MNLDGRRLRGQRREDAIIDAARALFIAHGYHGTTLAKIIATSGGSRETIYRAFGDKRGLLGAIIARVGDPFAAAIDALPPGRPARDVLTGIATDLMAFWSSTEGRAINRLVLSEGAQSPEILDTWHANAVAPSLDALARLFAREPELATLSGGGAARQFLLLLMAEAAFATIVPGESEPLAAIVARTVDRIVGRAP